MKHRGLRAVAAIAAALVSACALAAGPVGTVTGLPLPRYASLKTDRVNLREGPSKDHATKWVFQRAGLPVEITAEFATWRRVRDSEGAEGWVLHTLLSGRRTALIGVGKPGEVYDVMSGPSEKSDVAAKLQSGVIVSIKRCDAGWCQVFGQGYKGYVPQTKLWGVYPDEKVDP